jgi:cytochrome c oxidase assembly protein subunit 11
MSANTSGERNNLKVAVVTASIACGMVGVAYAAVPLYQLFCQVTGFGGTTQRAEAAPLQALDKTIRVTFDANVNHGLSWSSSRCSTSRSFVSVSRHWPSTRRPTQAASR